MSCSLRHKFHNTPSPQKLKNIAIEAIAKIERGDPEQIIDDIDNIEKATDKIICGFFTKPNINMLNNCHAAACIASSQAINVIKEHSDMAILISENPRLSIAKLLKMFYPTPQQKTSDIDPTAKIDNRAKIANNVKIGAYSVIAEDVDIAEGVVIGHHVTIEKNCIIGANSFIGNGVHIECSMIGNNVKIHPHSVIGKSGFGYELPKDDTPCLFLPHIGHVTIGDHVDIGAHTVIDRGQFSATSIGDGTAIGNLIQIGHNCQIEKNCMLVDKTAIGGSVTLKRNVIISGNSTVRDHRTIGAYSIIRACSIVFEDIPAKSDFMGVSNNYQRLSAMKSKKNQRKRK